MKDYTYKKGQNEFLDLEFKTSAEYGKVKIADKTIFWKKGLKWYCVSLSSVKRAFRRVEAVNTKMCCGNVNFDIQKLILILEDDTELELLIGEGTVREAEVLFEKLKEKDSKIQFGKL